QINGATGAGIEEALIGQFVFPGERDQAITANAVGINALSNELINTLVQLDNVQFSDDAVGTTYADAENRQSLNLDMEDCDGNTIVLRSSGFADFASEITPDGNGTITGIYSVFGQTKQFFIRDLNDIAFDAARCNGSNNPPQGSEDLMSIENLRAVFTVDNQTNAPANRKIIGIVISDRANGNTSGQNLVIQDGNSGIVVRFDEDHTFNLGDEVEIVVSSLELLEFNGLLQINNVPLGNAKLIGTNNVPEPREASINEILANAEAWESTVVKINDVTFSGGPEFSSNTSVSDATGSIILFTRNAATFASTALPSTATDMFAVVSQFTDTQLFIRNLSDLGATNNPPGGSNDSILVNQAFSSLSDDTDIALSGWLNVAVKGTRVWRADSFQGNGFAQATAFQDSNSEMEAWLITPSFNADTARLLSFRSAQAFYVHAGLSVLISTDFDGSDISGATWTELTVPIANNSQSNYDWVESGEIDLSAFTGTNVYVAFRYTGTGSQNTTTFRIDDVQIRTK
ncbi:MAG: DUF5689 domain-containing protein, partial [Bacteroidota bacterium]